MQIRTIVVAATIVGSIGLSLTALVMDRLMWPFAHYPMYSTLFGPGTIITRAVGVTDDGRELPLPRQIEPRGFTLDIFVGNAERSDDAPARLTRIADAVWAEYERQRAAGMIGGTPFRSVRIYRDTIEFEHEPHIRRANLVSESARR